MKGFVNLCISGNITIFSSKPAPINALLHNSERSLLDDDFSNSQE
jgi:hypothetical protein